MIFLQVTPPLIPDAGTLDLIIGPYGAVFLLSALIMPGSIYPNIHLGEQNGV